MWQWWLYRWFMRTADMLTPLLARLPGKTGEFFAGRLRTAHDLEGISPGGIWIHAASAGEFEQAKPLLDALRRRYPQLPVTVSFFSPSGYRRFKGKIPARVVYLPLDSPRRVRPFLDKIRPQMALIVKYEFWPVLLAETGKRHIPLFLVSGIFRPGQALWRWKPLRDGLLHFTHFFVQDEASASLLQKQGFENVSVTGDTRFDTVLQTARTPVEFPVVKHFKAGGSLLIAGSTWPADEKWLIELLKQLPAGWKMMIVPHEPTPTHISRLVRRLPEEAVLYTKYTPAGAQARVLIGDTTGLLKYVYRYGEAAYIGGGFGKGIHNTLEAAVYGIPLVFGPAYGKFKEAVELIENGAAFPIKGTGDVPAIVRLLEQPALLKQAGQKAAGYVQRNGGATRRIMKFLEKYLN